MLDLVQAGIDGALQPFSRGCFAPGHFTASAFVLSPVSDALLLILHAKLGFWMQPGGHIDPEDADVEAAARRELLEETGLSRLELLPGSPSFLDLDIHTIPARKSEPQHEHFDLRFLFRSAQARLRGSDEVRGIQWVPLSAIEGLRSDASVMRAVQRIRSLP